jgi:hypothetical protein
MAEMELDDVWRGTKSLNMQLFGRQALDAASAEAGKFIEKQPTSDLAGWSTEQWESLIWTVLAAGIAEAATQTQRRTREIIASIDEIPYK